MSKNLTKAKIDQFDWTPRRIQQLKALKGSGETPTEIAAVFGISRESIRRQLAKMRAEEMGRSSPKA